MNLQTWVKWVTEIDAITGGAIIQLRPGPYDGMTIIVRWMLNEEPYEYKHIRSLTEIENMAEADQSFVLEQITHAVSRAIEGEGIDKKYYHRRRIKSYL